MTETKRLIRHLLEGARAIALEKHDGMTVWTKDDGSVCTSVDIAVSDFFHCALGDHGFSVITEEDEDTSIPFGKSFVIDPIDGTGNLAKGHLDKSWISIALVDRDEDQIRILEGDCINLQTGVFLSDTEKTMDSATIALGRSSRLPSAMQVEIQSIILSSATAGLSLITSRSIVHDFFYVARGEAVCLWNNHAMLWDFAGAVGALKDRLTIGLTSDTVKGKTYYTVKAKRKPDVNDV